MLHSTKSVNVSLNTLFFRCWQMSPRAGWNGFAGRI